MRRASDTSFAPRWLKCCACAVGVIVLPAFLLLLATSSVDDRIAWGLVPATWIYVCALRTLTTGQPPRTVTSLAIDMLRGHIQARHEDRREIGEKTDA